MQRLKGGMRRKLQRRIWQVRGLVAFALLIGISWASITQLPSIDHLEEFQHLGGVPLQRTEPEQVAYSFNTEPLEVLNNVSAALINNGWVREDHLSHGYVDFFRDEMEYAHFEMVVRAKDRQNSNEKCRLYITTSPWILRLGGRLTRIFSGSR
jgi:hypothetical protein